MPKVAPTLKDWYEDVEVWHTDPSRWRPYHLYTYNRHMQPTYDKPVPCSAEERLRPGPLPENEMPYLEKAYEYDRPPQGARA